MSAVPRYLLGAVRSLSPAAALLLTLAMVLGAAGVADGAVSGAFILGKANSESATASLSNSRGIPLALSAPKNKAPLAVNRSTMVKNLNAQFTGGLSAAGLKLSGGEAFLPPNADVAITSDVFTKVVQTPKLAAGIYYVTATALVDVTTGDTGGFCAVQDGNSADLLAEGGGDGTNFVQASESIAVQLPHGGQVEESCIVDGTNSGTEVIDAGITAIRLLSSSGRPAAG